MFVRDFATYCRCRTPLPRSKRTFGAAIVRWNRSALVNYDLPLLFRTGFSGLQQGICRLARPLEADQGRRQSGGSNQRMPEGGAAEERRHLCVFLHDPEGFARDLLAFVVAGSGEAPEGKSNYRDHAIRLGDRSRRRPYRKGALGAGRNGAADAGARSKLEQTPPVRISTPSTTSTRCWSARSSRAVHRKEWSELALRTGRRSKISTTKWTCAVSRPKS